MTGDMVQVRARGSWILAFTRPSNGSDYMAVLWSFGVHEREVSIPASIVSLIESLETRRIVVT
jgi:hypothetical protein